MCKTILLDNDFNSHDTFYELVLVIHGSLAYRLLKRKLKLSLTGWTG